MYVVYVHVCLNIFFTCLSFTRPEQKQREDLEPLNMAGVQEPLEEWDLGSADNSPVVLPATHGAQVQHSQATMGVEQVVTVTVTELSALRAECKTLRCQVQSLPMLEVSLARTEAELSTAQAQVRPSNLATRWGETFCSPGRTEGDAIRRIKAAVFFFFFLLFYLFFFSLTAL